MNAYCRLCKATAVLKESHIIPAFVYRWMKDSSATGYIRSGNAANLRVQDGEKRYLLCFACEQRLSKWETAFAENLFHPLIVDGGRKIAYQEWLLKFCVSISWRVLTLYANDGLLDNLSEQQRVDFDLVLKKWSDFLLGIEHNPGQHEQHFIPLGPVDELTVDGMPKNINRYFLRAGDYVVATGDNGTFVYSKFAQFIIVGFISYSYPKQWVGTKIRVNNGVIGRDQITFPQTFLDFIFDRCRRVAQIDSSISPNQQAKIRATLKSDIEGSAKSATFHAIEHDIKLFGRSAIHPEKSVE